MHRSSAVSLMRINFQEALANAEDYAEISYSATPIFKFSELTKAQLVDTNQLTFTHSGGTALFKAGQVLQVASNTILVPSYHCPAALEPFIALGFECVFYHVKPDLSPDIEHLERLIVQYDITHCLVINYFGILSHLDAFTRIIANNNIAIIHDCAHALFQLLDCSEQPSDAAATICSINKILPSIDGGIVTFKHPYAQQLTKVGKIEEFKALLYLLGITPILNKLRFAFKQPSSADLATVARPRFRYFEASRTTQQCFSHTIALLRHSDLASIALARRDNYQYLCLALSNLKLGVPLQQELDEHSVPYVLPFLLHNAQDFAKLRKIGIQCLRWEEVAQSECSISQDYRFRLLQLPCHHQLSRQQLDDMIKKIKGIL